MSNEEAKPSPSTVGTRQSRDATVLIVGRVLSTVSDALLPLVLVRVLDKGDVGVLGGVLLVYQTVALVIASGLPASLMYQMPGREPAERRAIAASMARGLLGLGALASLLLLGTGALHALTPGVEARVFSSISPGALQGVAGSLALLAAFPLGDLPARMLPNLLVIEGRADAAAKFVVAKSLAIAVFVLVPALLGLGVQAVILSYSVCGLLQGAWLLYALRSLYGGAARVASPVTFRETVRFALPLGATEIVAQLNQRIDRYLVAASFSALMFAEYHVGAFQIPILTTIAYSVGTAYTPMYTQLFRDGKAREAIAVWRGTVNKTSLLVVPLSAVFVIAAEELVTLLFTANYAAAAPVFRCYALATAGRVAAFGSVIVAAGKPQYVLRAALITLGSNAALSALGLWLFGFVGPAVGTCVAFIPMVLGYCYYIARAAELRTNEIFPLGAYLKVVAVAAVAAVPALLVRHYLHAHPAVVLLAVAAIELTLFTLIGRLTGLIADEDLQFVKQRLRLGR